MRKPKRYGAGQVSLERALSKLGIASRTVAAKMITEGRVCVNGKVLNNPKVAVNPEKSEIIVDGKETSEQKFVAFILHKPKNTVCSSSDEKGRDNVISIIKTSVPHLHSVGRLDFTTTGLLILTNDTQLSAYLTDPKNKIPRTYLVTVRGELTEDRIKQIRIGVSDEGEFLKADEVKSIKVSGKESQVLVTLTEGKNREIRRLMQAVHCEVTALKRVSYGPVELGELEPGVYKSITLKKVLEWFPEAKTKLR